MSERICFEPIGSIHSPFSDPDGMPIQPAGARGVRGQVRLDERFRDGLKDLDGFSHIILVYYFHRAGETRLRVTPFLDDQPRGIFATRAPCRPARIGISVVRLEAVNDNVLEISDVDILDGTPLLDIKPYVPEFDIHTVKRSGWLENNGRHVSAKRADKRFK